MSKDVWVVSAPGLFVNLVLFVHTHFHFLAYSGSSSLWYPTKSNAAWILQQLLSYLSYHLRIVLVD